jgi:hypothetical protein
MGPLHLATNTKTLHIRDGATRDGAFLLLEAELMRAGSSVAYLDIS